MIVYFLIGALLSLAVHAKHRLSISQILILVSIWPIVLGAAVVQVVRGEQP